MNHVRPICSVILLVLNIHLIHALVQTCDKSRAILDQEHGFVMDGVANLNYTQNTHCEWLIQGRHDKKFISLIFHHMDTECGYDYVFVYDGNSMNDSKLLGKMSFKFCHN